MVGTDFNYLDYYERGLIEGTDEYSVMNYEFSSESGDEIKDNGLIYDSVTGRWFKVFKVHRTMDNMVVELPVMMSVSQEGDTYTFKTSSIIRQRSAEEMIDKTARAFGLNLKEDGIKTVKDKMFEVLRTGYLHDKSLFVHEGASGFFYDFVYDTQNQINDFYIPEYLSKDNILHQDKDLIDFIYDLFNDEFGDVSRLYKGNYIEYPDGTVGFVNTNVDNLPDKISYAFQEGDLAGGFSPDQINEFLKDLLSEDDEYINAVKEHKYQRIGFSTAGVGPNIFYLYLYGYDIVGDNATVINGIAQAQITNINAVLYQYDIRDGSKSYRGHIENGSTYTTTLLTQPTAGTWYTGTGLSTGTGNTFNATMFDSVGAAAFAKPYDLIPGYVYPTDYSSYTNTISDKPIEPTPPPQPITQIGKPGPDPVIKIINPPGGTIPPIGDEISDPTDTDPTDEILIKGVSNVWNLSVLDTGGETGLGTLQNWLWDKVNIDKLLQIWANNPTDAIYSLHQLYVHAPVKTADETIFLGYVTTGIECKKVKNRYIKLDFGRQLIKPKFNNFNDYKTRISLYLPFCSSGIVQLDTDEVMDSALFIRATVDVMTGDVLYKIQVNRHDRDTDLWYADYKTIATYTGNCAVPIPYSSTSTSNLVSSSVGLIGSVMTGNVAGIASSVNNAVTFNKSGNIGSSIGAMGFKKPYLIIEYPKVNNISERGKLFGYQANKTVKVGDVKGYAEFERVHVDTIGNATDTEKAMIDSLLKSGVIL